MSSRLSQTSLHLVTAGFMILSLKKIRLCPFLGLLTKVDTRSGIPWEFLCYTGCTGKQKLLFTQFHKDLQVHAFFFFFFFSLDGITIFRPSTFFIKILSSTGVRIRVQMKPVMQLSITVDHSYQNRTSGRTHPALSVCS